MTEEQPGEGRPGETRTPGRATTTVPPGERGATRIADRVVAKIAAQAAKEALGAVPVGGEAPTANVSVHHGSARVRIGLELDYPAGGESVIGVAASNASAAVDDWSIHGPQNDVSAPGANVLVAYHANGDCLAGSDRPYTSWSAGFVSGLAAQLRQRFPRESAEQIAYRITASADRPRMSVRDDAQGWGEIRPYEALTMTLDPNRPGPPFPGATASRSETPDSTEVTPLSARTDPLAPARVAALWWCLAAVGLCVLALVLRPWLVGAVTRRTPRP